MTESNSNEQSIFMTNIHNIETGIDAIRNDTHTMIRGRTVADTIGDEEIPVNVVTDDFMNVVKSIRECLRDGLRQKKGWFTRTATQEPSFWSFIETITPKANMDHILGQIADIITREEDSIELMEVAWILLAINDGTLADYIQLCSEVPLSSRVYWYSRRNNAMMLDDAKLEILKDVALQLCDIYFQVDLNELWDALNEDKRVKEMTLSEGLLAPAPSPVLVGVDIVRTYSSDGMPISGDSMAFTRSITPQLRRYTEGDVVEPLDKETLRTEAADLDQIMPSNRASRLQSTISSIKEKTIDTANEVIDKAINVAEEQAERLRQHSKALKRNSSITTELPSPHEEQVVPDENVRMSLFERMRESFDALVGEPFDGADSSSEPFEGAQSEEYISERIPSASSTKSLGHSEKGVEEKLDTALSSPIEAPRRPRLSSIISNMSIDPSKESQIESVIGRQSLGGRKSMHD